MTIKMTKSVCEKYTVQLEDMPSWAEIVIDEGTGMVAIHSDYGNWAYGWPRHGRKSLKHFLAEAGKDKHYMIHALRSSATTQTVYGTTVVAVCDTIESRY